MKVTGYRSLTTEHYWGRLIGDANGVMPAPCTDVHVLILETDNGLDGDGLGADPAAAVIGPHVRPARAGLRLAPDPHRDGSSGVAASRRVEP